MIYSVRKGPFLHIQVIKGYKIHFQGRQLSSCFYSKRKEFIPLVKSQIMALYYLQKLYSIYSDSLRRINAPTREGTDMEIFASHLIWGFS